MRIFLAIDLPQKSKEQLDQELDDLKIEYPQLAWVSKENFHITLVFFGEINEKKTIVDKIKHALYDAERFYLYSYKADVFISKKIVLYLGFRREKLLESLVSKINTILDLKNEKKFVPHLTIARAKIPSKQQYFVLKKKLDRLEIQIDFPVKKIYLYRSILGGKKPLYKKIAIFDLLEKG